MTADRHNPRKHRVSPGEVLMVSAVLALFVGFCVILGTREWKLTLIFAGVGFIVGVVVFSVLSLASAPREINGPVLGEPFPRAHDERPVEATTHDMIETSNTETGEFDEPDDSNNSPEIPIETASQTSEPDVPTDHDDGETRGA